MMLAGYLSKGGLNGVSGPPLAGVALRSNYLKDISALPDFLLVVWSDDEAFSTEALEPLMHSQNEKGAYMIVPSVGHLDSVHDPEAYRAITGFLQ